MRYDEVAAGAINHAIRITVPTSQKAYIWPARHQAGSTTNTNYPRMGEWFRLKATHRPQPFDPAVRPIIVALQKYGAIVADNGSAWYMSGVPDSRWDNDKLADPRAHQGQRLRSGQHRVADREPELGPGHHRRVRPEAIAAER